MRALADYGAFLDRFAQREKTDVSGPADIVARAMARGDRALSEYDAKQAARRLRHPRHARASRRRIAQRRSTLADELAGPVALKGCHATLLHKTEMDMVRLGVQGTRGGWPRL